VIVVVPAVTPVTTPVVASINATAVLLDVQTPLAVVLDNVVVDPTQTDVVPVMDTDGIVLIVIVALSEFVPQAFVA
jgi:hypothetical protein